MIDLIFAFHGLGGGDGSETVYEKYMAGEAFAPCIPVAYAYESSQYEFLVGVVISVPPWVLCVTVLMHQGISFSNLLLG